MRYDIQQPNFETGTSGADDIRRMRTSLENAAAKDPAIEQGVSTEIDRLTQVLKMTKND